MASRLCTKCDKTLPDEAFVLYGRTRGFCGDCVKRQQNEAGKKRRLKPSHADNLAKRRERERIRYHADEAFRQKIRALCALYSQTDAGKESRRRAAETYRRNNRLKVDARSAVNHAIESGKIPSPKLLPCVECKGQASEYHHCDGYDRDNWLRVVAVCKLCHEQLDHMRAMLSAIEAGEMLD